MKKIFLTGLVILAAALASGCAPQLVETVRNTKTIYGDTMQKVKIEHKVVLYKIVLYKHNLFGSIVSDEILLEPNEFQKKFAE